jgi:stress response protein SCP2
MELTRGQRVPLSDLIRSITFRVAVDLQGVACDVSCFGLDAQGTLADDRYMVFFNQPHTPCGGIEQITLAGFVSGFNVALDRLPDRIDRLVFVAAMDGPGVMRQLSIGRVVLFDAGQEAGTFAFQGTDFDQERALMLIELYRKGDGWRLATTGQGFNGGLDALVRHFGGVVAEEAPSPAVPPPARLSLEKRIEQEAPHLLSLAKKQGWEWLPRFTLDKIP